MQKIKSLFTHEAAAAFILLGILIAFLNPTGLLMPESTFMFLILMFVITYFVYTGFIWKESQGDEREQSHRLLAGRFSFFAGTATLLCGIVVQSLQHEIDPWMIITLGVMILTKIVIRIYSQIVQ